MTVESLIATLDVEEKARSKDVPRSGPPDTGPSNANVVEAKSGGNKNKNWKGKERSSRTLNLRRRRILQT
jgi:hypothetical protein